MSPTAIKHTLALYEWPFVHRFSAIAVCSGWQLCPMSSLFLLDDYGASPVSDKSLSYFGTKTIKYCLCVNRASADTDCLKIRPRLLFYIIIKVRS